MKVEKHKGHENTEKEEEKIQQLYFEMQLIDQQTKQMQRQLAMLDDQLNQITVAIEGIDGIKESKIGDEILVPITNGIFLKANIKDNKEFIVNVGGGVAVKKGIDDSKNLLERQMEELINYRNQILKSLNALERRAKEIEREVSEIKP